MNIIRYRIREFTLDDLDVVININRENLPENYPPFFFVEHYNNFPKAFLVAESELDKKILGYIMCRVEWKKGFFSKLLVRVGHVISLAVIPPARRKGIATSLMKGAMEAMKKYYNVKEYYLEVRTSNLPAIRLYEKLGYIIVKRIPYYYSDGEDCYIMARTA